MKIDVQIERLIKRLGIKPALYNTNNAWGFGGSSGKEWSFSNGWKYRAGRASTRHQGTFPCEYALNSQGQKFFGGEGVLALIEACSGLATPIIRTPTRAEIAV
jgi:hypothetical protein